MTKIPSVKERVEEIKFQFCFNGLVKRMDGTYFTETELVEEITHAFTAEREAGAREERERVHKFVRKDFHSDFVENGLATRF